MHLPRPALLSRIDARLDTPFLRSRVEEDFEAQFLRRYGIRDAQKSGELAIPPFGYSSFLKFESMHNFDLGITADTLQAIPRYFSVFLGHCFGPRVVNSANHHQHMLPRAPTTATFRLSSVGSIIAMDYANVTAQNQYSALCFLPFLLRGSNVGVKGSYIPMFFLYVSSFCPQGELCAVARVQHIPG